MREDVAVKVLEGFRKNLKSGCDIDRALGVAIGALKRPRVSDTPRQYTGPNVTKKYSQNGTGNHGYNKNQTGAPTNEDHTLVAEG